MSRLPDPARRHPIVLPNGEPHLGTVHLRAVLDHPNIEVGEFTYYSDVHTEPEANLAERLAPYLFRGAPETLRIGKFCQIASDVRFLTAGANHETRALTSYPFPVFDPATIADYAPDTRDTVIGNDVWLGYGALVCPGARIGSGVIVGAGAVVRGRVPDYAVLAGNPAAVVRMRFPDDVIAKLVTLAWWDWPADRIEAAAPALMAGDIAALERYAR